jgi:hypothetical protein
MRIKRIAVVLAVFVVVFIAGLVLWRRWSYQSKSPQAQSESAGAAAPSQQQLLNEIIQQGVTPERAKLLFSMQIGPLPGVTIPSNIPRDPSQFDGTPAATYLMGVWDTLTPEQRQVATKLLGLPASSSARRIDGTRAVVIDAAFVTENKEAYDYRTYLKDADGTLSAFLNVPGIYFSYDVDYDTYPSNSTTKAMTLSWSGFQLLTHTWLKSPNGSCHVHIYNKIFVEDVHTAEDARSIMTHEMMHCYQQREVGDLSAWLSVPPWIAEGEAVWAQATIVPAGSSVLAYDWNTYATSLATPYSNRGQDAIGVFGHLTDTAGSLAVWPKLLPVVRRAVPQSAPSTLSPFDLLIQGSDNAYLSSWGSSYFLTSGKVPWTMSEPGSPPTTGDDPGTMKLDADTNTIISVTPPYTARILKLSGNADVAYLGLMTGYARLHDNTYKVDTPLDSSGALALCLKPEGCTCPKGSPGDSLGMQRATMPLSLGMEAGESGTQILMIGKQLDLHCKKPDPDPPNPPGGGGGGGGGDPDNNEKTPRPPIGGTSQGDTHMWTFDGLTYDFQVVGEYTLVRSTKDDFVVQVRQAPVLKSRTATVNQAIATKIGDKRVTVSIENGISVLRIDGLPITDSVPKLAGGSIQRSTTMYGVSYLIEYSDGTTVRVEQLGDHVINVRVKPAEARRGALAGLLGDDDGSRDNDLMGVGGARLGLQPKPQDLTHSLADAWRITQSQSLFDYLPGQSTATFTDRTFPDVHVDLHSVANRAEAEKNCREARITDPHLLDNCILDFAITSDFLFTSSYSHEQQVMAARAAIATPAVPGLLNTIMMSGSVTDPASKPSFEFKAKAGDIIWIGAPDCTDNYMGMSLVDPSGKAMAGGAWPCAKGRVELPTAGTYTLKAYGSQNPLGTYSVPIRFVRADHRRDVKYGDIISGRIETRGIHDVYTFSGQAGDVLRLSGEGCDLSNLVVGIILPNGHDVLGPSCRAGSDSVLMETGTFQLVINSADGGEGAYHFLFQGAKGK